MKGKRLNYKLILLFVLMLKTLLLSAQQQVVMPTTGESTLTLTAGNCYEVLDPGGAGDYPGQCNSILYVSAPDGYTICVDGVVNLGATAYLALYNGSSTSSPRFYTHQSGSDSFSRATAGNNMVIQFTTDTYSGSPGYSLSISAIPPKPYNVVPQNTTFYSSDVVWSDVPAATQWYVKLNGRTRWDTVNTRFIHYDGLQCNKVYGVTVRNNLPRCSASTCLSEGFGNIVTPCYLLLAAKSVGNCADSDGVATLLFTWSDLVPNASEWYVRWRKDVPDNPQPWNYDTVYQQQYSVSPAECCQMYEFEILNDNVGVHDSCICKDYIRFRSSCENNIPCITQVDSVEVLSVDAHRASLKWVDHTPGAIRWTVRAHNMRTGEDRTFHTSERRASLTGLYPKTSYSIHITNNIGGEYVCDVKCKILTNCANLVYNQRVVDSTDESVTLEWQDSTSSASWVVVYQPERGGYAADTVWTSTPSVTLTGLRPGTIYHYIVYNDNLEPLGQQQLNDCVMTFRTLGTICECYADFDSYICYETYCGSYDDPMMQNRLVNYGPHDSLSRHTVHNNPNELDPRTGNQLHTLAPGGSPSVRLGNWGANAESESIVYRYKVDTSKYNVLILNYAAVLQNPDHDADHQPKFSVVISDTAGRAFDDPCLRLNFVASEDLGWNANTAHHLLWKDWTSVALNLSDLHDSTIMVTMTTSDCADRGHYGYAYFSFNCQRADIEVIGCGNGSERTLIAPEGFNYYWYKEGFPENPLSTERILETNEFATYVCRLTTLTDGGENCGFEKRVTTGERFPFARADYRFCDTIDCQVAVRFEDKSFVSFDIDHPDVMNVPIESRLWTFDDGTTSTEASPIHRFPQGSHWAMLRVGLSDDQCVDSTIIYFVVGNLPLPSPLISFTSEYASLDNMDVEVRNIGTNCKRSLWYAFGEQVGEGASIIYHYPISEDYVEMLLVAFNREGCADSTSSKIGFQDATIWVPNVFTPGRETNNRFVVLGSNLYQVEVHIFTRTGAWVCTFDGLTQGWDGTKDGVPLKQGAYVYKIIYSDIFRPSQMQSKEGSVLLLRN